MIVEMLITGSGEQRTDNHESSVRETHSLGRENRTNGNIEYDIIYTGNVLNTSSDSYLKMSGRKN
jgi:hypothetical protein